MGDSRKYYYEHIDEFNKLKEEKMGEHYENNNGYDFNYKSKPEEKRPSIPPPPPSNRTLGKKEKSKIDKDFVENMNKGFIDLFFGDDWIFDKEEQRVIDKTLKGKPFDNSHNYDKELEKISNLGEKDEYYQIDKEYDKITKQQFTLFLLKSRSYGKENITMGLDLKDPKNKQQVLSFLWMRMQDKMNRLKRVLIEGKGIDLKDEKLKDTFQDLANYSIISQIVLNDEWK